MYFLLGTILHFKSVFLFGGGGSVKKIRLYNETPSYMPSLYNDTNNAETYQKLYLKHTILIQLKGCSGTIKEPVIPVIPNRESIIL